MKLSANVVHLVIGLATIAAIVVLAVTKTVNASEALTIITGISGVLLGTSSMAMSPTGTQIVPVQEPTAPQPVGNPGTVAP